MSGGHVDVTAPTVAPAPVASATSIGGLGASYRAASRARSGGFLYSTVVSDRLGSCVAAVALRLDVHPSVLTLVNLVLGIAGSTAVVVGAGRTGPNWLVCLGVALWQVAYVFDCADGQVARASGKTTPSGARFDPLVDLAVQCSVIAALTAVVEHWSHTSTALLAVFAGTWSINLITFLAKKASSGSGGASSLLHSSSWVVDVAKLPRDYGFLVLVLGVWAAASPTTLVVPVLAVLVVNVTVLASHIAVDGVTSMHTVQPDVREQARTMRAAQVAPVGTGTNGTAPATVAGDAGR